MVVRLAIPDLISNSYFPAIAAVELGLFEAEGIAASLELMFPVTRTMAALRDGGVDFVAGAAHATLAAFPGWRGAKLVCALAQRMYWFLVVRSDLKPRRGDVSVVRGLRIGAAPGPDTGLLRLLAEAGIDPAREGVQVGPVPGTAEASVSFGVTAARALEEGKLDGFWANGMGAQVAVDRGVGTIVLDVRRGEGPPAAVHFTFPALVATEARIRQQPDQVAGAVRAIVRAQQILRADPERATPVGRRLFPPMEASLIAELIRRDLPYYDPTITPESVERLNAFAQDAGLLTERVSYEQVVATQFAELWQSQPRSSE
jgi:ABC-type nitrate/sulfonate/bicarbonate transport system substrate-binding protein